VARYALGGEVESWKRFVSALDTVLGTSCDGPENRSNSAGSPSMKWLDSARARLRQALAAFGGVEKHKEALRHGRGLAWVSGMSLDVKLGGRMLRKYPGLTLAGGLALAIAIGIGAGWYDLTSKFLAPTIPLPEGDRLVSIETQNVLTSEPESRVVRDFLEWRHELRTIEELGAYRTNTRSLTVDDAVPVRIRMAELTANAFRTARVPPVLGRALLDSDEVPGAPSVIVVGYDVWQRSFGGRRDAIGSAVKLGNTPATVIGVMPDGFGYPVNHDAWTPLRLRARGRPDQRHRPALAWCHAGASGCRAARARRTSGRGASGDARASPAEGDSTG
jgi:putative ABC transport system permease protein